VRAVSVAVGEAVVSGEIGEESRAALELLFSLALVLKFYFQVRRPGKKRVTKRGTDRMLNINSRINDI